MTASTPAEIAAAAAWVADRPLYKWRCSTGHWVESRSRDIETDGDTSPCPANIGGQRRCNGFIRDALVSADDFDALLADRERLRGLVAATHQLTMIDTSWTTYWYPSCSCGWMGKETSVRESAEAAHAAHVAAVLAGISA